MQIGINLLYLIPDKVGGTETYARELVENLSNQVQSKTLIILYCSREAAPTFKPRSNIKIVTLPFYAKNRFIRLVIEQTFLPFIVWRQNIDVLLSLGYSAPIFHLFPSVVTIHDLNWYYHPEDFSLLQCFIWKCLTITSARSADHIIAISTATSDSLKQILNIPAAKISIILHGTPNHKFVKDTKHLYFKQKYLFTVLAGYPHKNLITLLRAFRQIHILYPDLLLVICGLGGRADVTNSAYIHRYHLDNVVKIIGYVSDEDLSSLYRGTEIFVFPSAYEGFGLPVIEAMSYQIPVVSSNAFSLKEVVGDGGLLVDPYDIDEYVHAVTSLLQSAKLRASIVSRGTNRISALKWSNTAHKTLTILQKYQK